MLAPARNADIGIAAIDCGADAVYIAGPDFGARLAAWNNIEDISRLCTYAHRFGARIFLTLNTTIEGTEELGRAHSIALAAQEAGIDAFIIRDPRIAGWKDISIPLHASTQCAIRTPERAKMFEDLGCSRLILERQLSLEQIKAIRESVGCDLESFVHGALCVGYSGECRLSEHLNGRSADKGDCIQACRSLYDLVDGNGKVLVRNKTLLSLKDYNLKERLQDLVDAGVSSFKIEGRLKNASYVKNVTRDYSTALDRIVGKRPDYYRRASFGSVSGGFTPDADKTFNRGYTELFLDGTKGRWASESPKSMGEEVGTVISVRQKDRSSKEIIVRPSDKEVRIHNGDGFTFISKDVVCGFRADVCDGYRIRCRTDVDITEGTLLFRNVSTAFEHELENSLCRREIPVTLDVKVAAGSQAVASVSDGTIAAGGFRITVEATSQDGRKVSHTFDCGSEKATNYERAEGMLTEGLSKRSGHYKFRVNSLSASSLPLLTSAGVNTIRREIAAELDAMPCLKRPLPQGKRSGGNAFENYTASRGDELLRSRYCIRHELGICLKRQGAAGKDSAPLYLVNNGRKLKVRFDCRNCEMIIEK